ncbi:MAG: hypothetical protein ACRDOG_00495, partial [Gaiellaceae bacterium]
AETALIVIGEQLLPVATEGMRRLAEAVDTHAEGAASAIGRIADAGGDVIDVMGDIGGVIGTDLGLSLSGGVLAMVGFALAVSKAIDVVKALRLALLGINPIIGLVSLAVGALAVAYIDARLRTDEFAQATDRAKQAMRNLVPAADEAKRADVALASARANLKAANVAVKDAEDALHEARKKGKPRDVARAEASLAQARAGARQAALGVEDAEKRNTDATKKLRAEKQRARDAVAQFDQKMGGLEQRMRQTQGRARGVKDRLGELNEEARKKAVARLAKEASDLADEGRSVADQLEKTNPKLAATMRNAADAAAAMGALADAWGRVISLPEARAFVARFSVITTVETNRVNRAAGGFVPGPRGAGDVVPAMLSPGEVVLNRAQQMRLGGPARIASMFGFTGREGPGFARGGLVSGLRAHGIDQIEQKYGLLQRLYGLPGSEAGEEFGPHETRRLVRNRQGLVNALQRERRRVRRKLRRDDDLEPFERRDLKRRLREIPFDITAARLDIRELRGQGRADGGGPDVDALIAQLGQLRLALGIQTSQLGILGSFARGTAFVPETGLAVLHRGEAVIPASKVRGGDGAFTPTIVVENHFAPGMEWLERFVDTRVRTSGNVDAVSSRIGARASERARARRF